MVTLTSKVLDISFTNITRLNGELPSQLQSLVHSGQLEQAQNIKSTVVFDYDNPKDQPELLKSQIEIVSKLQPKKWDQDYLEKTLPALSEVIPSKLYISGKQGSWNNAELLKLGITHILSAASEVPQRYQQVLLFIGKISHS